MTLFARVQTYSLGWENQSVINRRADHDLGSTKSSPVTGANRVLKVDLSVEVDRNIKRG